MKPRISMITLGVNDMAKSVSFYKNGLGFPQMASPPEAAFFTLNGSWLGLFNYEALAKDSGLATMNGAQGEKGTKNQEDHIFKGFTLAHNVASENEVDTLLAQALSAGGELSKAAQKPPGADIRAILKTPMVTCGKSPITPSSGLAPQINSVGSVFLNPKPFTSPRASRWD